MEMYFSAWTLVMFILTVFIAILGFSLMQQSMNKILRQMDQQRARQDEFWKRQDEAWQRLFAKADNTERMSQEILTRLASRDVVH
jgi:predicted Holliday junction resolvase-like endonuclease